MRNLDSYDELILEEIDLAEDKKDRLNELAEIVNRLTILGQKLEKLLPNLIK